MAQAPTQIAYGSKGPEVSKLQSYLKSLGLYGGKVEGIWGPKTQKSLLGFQKFFGLPATGQYDPTTQTSILNATSDPFHQVTADPLISDLMSIDPRFRKTMMSIAKGGGASKALVLGAHKANNKRVTETGYGHNGDLLLTGNPQNDDVFMKSAMKDLDPDYQQGLDMYKADFYAGLQKQQQDYAAYLEGRERQLAVDKGNADVNEAQSGTLFSTGRGQRRQALADTYNADIAQKRRDTEYGIGSLGRNFEQNYGSDIAGSADYDIPTGNVDGGSLEYGSTGLRRAYKPVGGIYGTKRRDYKYQTGQLALKKRYAPYTQQ